MGDAPNSLAGRRRKWHAEVGDDVKAEPTAIILSVRLDNGAFESSVTVPLTDHIDFDKHASRWLALAHAALEHGIIEMSAVLPSIKPISQDEGA